MTNQVPIFGIKELARATEKRIKNRYDSNIAVSGVTGSGKSTFLWLFFHCFRGFKVKEKLTFLRSEMIDLIKNSKFSQCWNDELIDSGFKRNFFDREQISLIETLTKYRSNFNIVGGAIPIFFTLDKELLKLFGMHINIIRRGIAVVHLPREGRLYTDDPWDTKINQKLEERWSKRKLKNPNFKIPYHKYTTFAGYVFFRALNPKEESKYESLKESKRLEAEEKNNPENKKENFYHKVLTMLKDGKLDEDGLFNICTFNDKSFSSVKTRLNQLLKDEGSDKTLKGFFKDKGKKNDSNNSYNNINPHGLNDILSLDTSPDGSN